MSTADEVVARWLRQRKPRWTEAAITWSITRSYVIDDHPNWDDARIDREVGRRLSAGESDPAHVSAGVNEEG
jgi:hypothetical protein